MLIVSGITDTERDDDLTEHLSRYGCIGRIVRIDSPESPYHKNVIIEDETESALKSLEPQLPFTFESPHQADLKYEVKALYSVNVPMVASSTTKGYLGELQCIAKLSGRSFADLLNEELSKCKEPVSLNKDETTQTAEEHLPVNAIPMIQTYFTQVSAVQENTLPLTDPARDAAFVPLPRMSVPNLNPPEVQCVVFEHIVKSQVTFIYIALLTIQIVSKQLHNIKIGK